MADRPDEVILARSDAALRAYGDSARGANWPNEVDRRVRFDVMLDVIQARGASPVVLCDLGCGTGELLAHLHRRGLRDIEYVGVDRSRLALEQARGKFPGVRFLELDVNDAAAGLDALACDYLVANGLFTVKWELRQAQMRAFVEGTIARVWPQVRRGIAFNVMSPVVDWERDDLYHAPMDELARFLHGLAGRRVRFRADYGLYEYTAYAWKTPAPERALTGLDADAVDTSATRGGSAPGADTATDDTAGRALDLLAGIAPALVQAARANHVYQQQALKSQLRVTHGRATAFAAYREAAGLGAGASLLKRPLECLHEAAARSEGYALLAPGGEMFDVPVPRVVGVGNQRPLRGRARPRWLGCIADVRVRSRSSVIESDGRVLLDTEPGELDSIDDRLDIDPAIFDADALGLWIVEPDPAQPPLHLAEAFSLVGAHTWAFGHWMWECLPRYAAARRSGRLPPMPVLVDQGMPGQHRQALQALLPDDASIVELPSRAVVRVDRLWCAPTPMYMPLFEHMNSRFRWDLLAAEPQAFADDIRWMRDRFLPGSTLDPARAPPGRRLFLGREPHRHRKMLNAVEIEDVARQEGFELIHPEGLDFRGQVEAMDEAARIAGPEGSAMFLALFARPGTRVTILNHPYTLGLPVLTSLLEALGIDVEVLVGPAETCNEELPHFLDYRIDPGEFARLLRTEPPG